MQPERRTATESDPRHIQDAVRTFQAAREKGIVLRVMRLSDELAKADAESRGEEPLRFVASLKANDRWDDYRSSKVNERIFEGLRNAATIKEEEAA